MESDEAKVTLGVEMAEKSMATRLVAGKENSGIVGRCPCRWSSLRLKESVPWQGNVSNKKKILVRRLPLRKNHLFTILGNGRMKSFFSCNSF